MDRLRGLMAPRATDAALDERYWTDGSAMSSTGMAVTPESALNVAAVYRCVSILANTTAMLPGGVFRWLERGRAEVRDHPVRQLLWRRPNPYQTPFEFKSMMLGHAALRGSAYARIARGSDGDELWPLHPDRMGQPELLESGRVRYQYNRPDGRNESFVKGRDLLVLNGLSTNGLRGLAVTSLAREGIGLAMATEKYGAALFGRGARFSGAVKLPKGSTIKTPAARKALSDEIRKAGAGPVEWHGVPIFEDGMEWQSIAMTNDDAQFLETRRFGLSDIARWFGVPPHMIGDVERSTSWGTGIEAQSIQFVQYGLMPWLTIFEQVVTDVFVTEPDLYVRFNVEGLLRGDTQTRFAVYGIGIDKGILSPNECRELENRNPRPGGDEYRDASQTVQVNGPPGTPPSPDEVDEEEDDEEPDQRTSVTVAAVSPGPAVSVPATVEPAATSASVGPMLAEQDARRRTVTTLRTSAFALGIPEDVVRKALARAKPREVSTSMSSTRTSSA